MNCDRFDERVQQLLDRREDPRDDWELVEHSSECLGCGASLTAVSKLIDRLRPVTSLPPLPSGFADRVLMAFRQAEVGTDCDTLHESNASSVAVQEVRFDQAAREIDRRVEVTSVGAVQPLSPAAQKAWLRRQWADWASPAALALALVIAVVVVVRPGATTPPSREVAPRIAMTAPQISSPFSLTILEGGVERWTPVFDSFGDESLSVVRPITRSFHVAYDLIRQTLLGPPAGVPADARLDRLEDRWA